MNRRDNGGPTLAPFSLTNNSHTDSEPHSSPFPKMSTCSTSVERLSSNIDKNIDLLMRFEVDLKLLMTSFPVGV